MKTANILYFANRLANTVTFFNTLKGDYIFGDVFSSRFITESTPTAVKYIKKLNRLYVINTGSHSLTVYNPLTGAYLNVIFANSTYDEVGLLPFGLAYLP